MAILYECDNCHGLGVSVPITLSIQVNISAKIPSDPNIVRAFTYHICGPQCLEEFATKRNPKSSKE